MGNETRRKIIMGSIENVSIMRKFTVLFLMMSIIPLAVLFYLYWDVKTYGAIQLTEEYFNIALIFIVLGILLGYGTMRNVIKALIDLSVANRKALENVLSPAKIDELSVEGNEISILAQSFQAITNRLEENVRSLELAKKTLHSVMSRVGQGISSMQDIDNFLELILETVTGTIGGKKGAILLYDREARELCIKTVFGEEQKEPETKIPLAEGSKVIGLLKEKGPQIIQKPFGELTSSKLKPYIEGPFACVPMFIKDKPRGIITISYKDPDAILPEDEAHLLLSVALQTTVAIENSRLSKNIESTYFETISALALAVDAKDKYSRGHLDRVAEYCMVIAKQLGLDEEDRKILKDAARLHDLGKIGIPDDVLLKGEDLNDQEWILMRKHPEIGESIIQSISSLNHLCDLVRHHHEKLDGSGYPDGLKAQEITPLVRILTVADIYDALTTDRPYRDKMKKEKAIQELRAMAGKLDQDIVEVFVEALNV